MQNSLLQTKRAPPFKFLCAAALALWIVGCFALILSALHAHHERTGDEGAHPGKIMLVTLAFPLSAILMILLLIPLIGNAASSRAQRLYQR